MPKAAIGILAHVDAGKTTLAEALLSATGAVRNPGRVDKGDSHLDTDPMERDRGITIFSSTATVEHGDARLTLVDTPGHVDFSAETERVLPALDYAILVVAANDGVQGHTGTLWRLLERYEVPAFVFVNKTDLAEATPGELTAMLQRRLGPGCLDFSDMSSDELHEAAAMTDELAPETLRRLVAERKVFPVFFGSALRGQGVAELLDGLSALVADKDWPSGFAARVYNVSHDERGERLAWLKVTGGELHVKDALSGRTGGREWTEKVNQVRRYNGAKYEVAPNVSAGDVCAVTGLSSVMPGDVLGAEPTGRRPSLEPALAYSVECGDRDVRTVLEALQVLAEEDPLLHVRWDEQLQEVRLSLMGKVQLEVVRRTMAERFGLSIDFGPGGILYKETVTEPVMGYGHFEPLRHYAEAHFLIEPLPKGSGVQFGSLCGTDDLDLNWQRLALTNAMEREHRGTLTGAPITDVRISLTAGRAHLKHTEGGDFRQAVYRAIRQGLMTAREQGAMQLLEPWYRFRLEVPADLIGRGLSDLQRMGASFSAPEVDGDRAVLEGTLPASELGDYAVTVSAYTGGHGALSCEFAGYEPCHDAERVVAEAAYEPEADLPNTPDSVFCSHGAGYTVKWPDVPAMAHAEDDPGRHTAWREADAAFFGTSR